MPSAWRLVGHGRRSPSGLRPPTMARAAAPAGGRGARRNLAGEAQAPVLCGRQRRVPAWAWQAVTLWVCGLSIIQGLIKG